MCWYGVVYGTMNKCSEQGRHTLLLFLLSSSTQVDSKHQPSGMLSVAVLYVQCVYVDVHVHENYRSQVDHICRSCGCVHPIRLSFSRTVGIRTRCKGPL